MKNTNVECRNTIALISGILPHLRAKPKSFADSLSQAHDDEVVGGQFTGNMKKHRSADAHYYKHWGDGLLGRRGGFWKKPLDSILVGGTGASLFLTHDVCYARGSAIAAYCTISYGIGIASAVAGIEILSHLDD